MTDNKLQEKILKIITDNHYGDYAKSEQLMELIDSHHLARLEAITPEMIEKQFVIDYTSSPSHYKMQRVMMNNVEADAKREGAKWVLKRLKGNDLSK